MWNNIKDILTSIEISIGLVSMIVYYKKLQTHSNPLYERLKFIAIFSSNLDEYFRVRVSQLRQLKRVDKSLRKRLALRPSKFVKQLLKKVH